MEKEWQGDLFGGFIDKLPKHLETTIKTRSVSTASRDHHWQVGLQPQLPMSCDGFESLFSWSDEEVEKARVGLLWASIQDVCDQRTNRATRDEVWAWIRSDEIHPFSYRVCVAAWDPRVDPDTLRDYIAQMAETGATGQLRFVV